MADAQHPLRTPLDAPQNATAHAGLLCRPILPLTSQHWPALGLFAGFATCRELNPERRLPKSRRDRTKISGLNRNVCRNFVSSRRSVDLKCAGVFTAPGLGISRKYRLETQLYAHCVMCRGTSLEKNRSGSSKFRHFQGDQFVFPCSGWNFRTVVRNSGTR